MKKILSILLIGITLFGCSNEPKEPIVEKVFESVTLPYVVVDKEEPELIDVESGEPLKSYYVMQSLTTRSLTDEENEFFLKEMTNSSTIVLNEQWVLLELDFGSGTVLRRHLGAELGNAIYNPKVILGSEVLYQVSYRTVIEEYTPLVHDNKDYGHKFSDRKYLYLVPKSFIKENVQLRINQEIYLDIEMIGV